MCMQHPILCTCVSSKKIVGKHYLQPISVLTEIVDYTPEDTDTETWEEAIIRRRKADEEIAKSVTQINDLIEEGPKQVDRRFFFNLNNAKQSPTEWAKTRRLFYKNTSRNRTTSAFGAIVQLQMNTRNPADPFKEKIFRPIVKRTDTADCCSVNLEEQLEKLLIKEEKYQKASSWPEVNKNIILAVTHFPCNTCIKKITQLICRQVRKLVLRVANIHDDAESTIISNWLVQCYRIGLKVELKAIQVNQELTPVRSENQCTKKEAKEWKNITKLGSRYGDSPLFHKLPSGNGGLEPESNLAFRTLT